MNPAPSTGLNRGAWMALTAAFLGWMFDGMEMGIFPMVAAPALNAMQAAAHVADEQFVQRWMGIVTALFLLGAAAGGLVFGWLGDRFGRVRAMTWSILCYSLFTGLCYFATQPWHLGALRFIAALGMGGEWALGVALVMECWPARARPLMAGCIGAAANLGYALIALIAIFFPITTESWRWVMMVGAAPALLTFFIRLFVPESERWRAAVQTAPSRPVREIFSAGLVRNTLLAIAFASVALIATWGIVQWIPLWANQMTADALKAGQARMTASLQPLAVGRSASVPFTEALTNAQAAAVKLNKGLVQGALPEMRRTLAILEDMGDLTARSADAASPGTPSLGELRALQARLIADAAVQPKVKAYIQLVSALGAVLGCVVAPLVGGHLGRRPVYFALCLFSLLVCSFLFRAFHAFGGGFLMTVGLVGFFTAAFYGWLPLYLPELFPTRVRATGQGLAFNFGRVLAAIGAWQMGSLMAFFDKSYPKAGAAVVLIYVVGMVLIWFGPETRNKPLPE